MINECMTTTPERQELAKGFLVHIHLFEKCKGKISRHVIHAALEEEVMAVSHMVSNSILVHAWHETIYHRKTIFSDFPITNVNVFSSIETRKNLASSHKSPNIAM